MKQKTKTKRHLIAGKNNCTPRRFRSNGAKKFEIKRFNRARGTIT